MNPPKLSIKKIQVIIKPVCVIIFILLFWEILARFKLLNTKVLSSPSEMVNSLLQLLGTGTLLKDVVDSVKRVLIGFILGSMCGIIVAILLGINKTFHEYLGFLIEFLRPIPPIAWIPIAILWFHLGDKPAYFLVALGAFFPVFTNTMRAIKGIELTYINLALSLGATKAMIFRKVLIPIVLPDLITGLRVGLGVGWIVVITAEMVGAQSGLGYMIQLNRFMAQMPNVIIGMIVIGIIGLLFSFSMNFIEDLILPWQKRMATIEREGR